MSNDTRSRPMTAETSNAWGEWVPDEGEEIMVNTPYDVFILPLRPSGLDGNGPRFVVHVPGPEQPAAPPQTAGDGCHCGTCTCEPNMTSAVRFDLSPAQKEGAIRDHLIALGWTPPGAQQPAPHPAITHCDNCGCDWLDNGLNPVSCPYCKQSEQAAEIEALRAELEDYRTNGAAAVKFAPGSAYWSDELHRLFGSDARTGIEVLETRYRQELARVERLAEALRSFAEDARNAFYATGCASCDALASRLANSAAALRYQREG